MSDDERRKVRNQFSNGGYEVSEETRKKLSENAKKQWQDPTMRKKLTHEPWNKGRKQ